MDENPYRSPLQTAEPADSVRRSGLLAFTGRAFVVLFRLWRIALGFLSILIGLAFLVLGLLNMPSLAGQLFSFTIGLMLAGLGYFAASRALQRFRRASQASDIENS